MMKQNRFLRLAAPVLVWAALGCPVAAATVLPDFSAATFRPGAPITNRYFPTVPGPTAATIAKGESPDGPIEERGERSTLGEGPEILGVGTTTVLDRAIENGLLVEETKDYYAQDSLGNVWYFGEDVTNYVYDEAGNLTGTNSSSSWRAGVSGALPGYIMPADLQLRMSFFPRVCRHRHCT